MEALKASSFLSSQLTNISNRPQTIQFQKPILFLTSNPKPTYYFSPNKSKFKLSSTISQTESNNPFSPATEKQGDEEKFDWFSHWYPIAAVCDLDKRVPHARRVIGLDIVIWWDRNEEKWQVFDDSCPHRLAPLSEGRIDQWGRLQCVYHGWCFNGSGACKFIPQAPPDGPPVHTSKKACAAVYPCIVQNRILWFWPRSEPQYEDIATKEKPPYIPELDDPTFTSVMVSRDIPYGYEVLIENFMDPAHVPYAHYGVLVPPRKPR
ncbi:Protochlorophyllide-dependent translocon component 52 chloroplastic [Thalictrum thalictroides]|uniref:Protochlorophyllide-dependent translocon component 52 chloroplastic n=1 Tax=Thalictrum thalictroides TaxID=46969 RepID=A0A7J6X537_THATH|nr:Protochlorophyllide-dependent translocon component 52 chloroplastic [Thalictrum thalictroides]